MKGTFAMNWIHKCDGIPKSSIFWKLSKVKCIRFTLSHLIQTRWTKNSFKWIITRNCHSGFRLLFIMPKPYGARPSWFGFFFWEKNSKWWKKKCQSGVPSVLHQPSFVRPFRSFPEVLFSIATHYACFFSLSPPLSLFLLSCISIFIMSWCGKFNFELKFSSHS